MAIPTHHPMARPNSALHAPCLVVEDSAFDSARICRILTRALGPMPVEVCTTLEEARVALTKRQTGLFFLDNSLPDGLGANFAIELSRNPKYARIPIVMVSDWPSPFMWEKAEAAGVLHVVSKSDFDAKFVLSAVRKARAKATRMT